MRLEKTVQKNANDNIILYDYGDSGWCSSIDKSIGVGVIPCVSRQLWYMYTGK